MKFQRKILTLSSGVIVLSPVISTISCGIFESSDKSKYEFMNYVDYIGDYPRKLIESMYSYSEFGDLPELKIAIREKKIAAGIGSDYYNAFLAGTGDIAKIDFGRLYKDPKFSDSKTLAKELEKLYTLETWNILKAIPVVKRNLNGNMLKSDGTITTDIKEASNDVDGDGSKDYLWEFMAPYFAQNKVIAVNIRRLYEQGNHSLSLKKGNDFIGQEDFQKLIETKTNDNLSYKNIFNVLKNEFGANQIIINNYMRDNLMIGSEEENGNIYSTPTKETYRKHVNNFVDTIKIFDSKPSWSDSGIGTLDALLDNEKGDAQVGILYNGDALYAYNGGSINAEKGQIRVITPKNSTFLLDGLVIPKYILDEPKELSWVYETIGDAFYSGVLNTYPVQKLLQSSTDQNQEASYTRLNNLFQNFDEVNYTPAFQSLYNYINTENNYFNQKDQVKIISSTKDASDKILGSHEPPYIYPDTNWTSWQNHITGIISTELESEIQTYYNNKTGH